MTKEKQKCLQGFSSEKRQKKKKKNPKTHETNWIIKNRKRKGRKGTCFIKGKRINLNLDPRFREKDVPRNSCGVDGNDCQMQTEGPN